jgi:hypothetical protein
MPPLKFSHQEMDLQLELATPIELLVERSFDTRHSTCNSSLCQTSPQVFLEAAWKTQAYKRQ